MKKYISIIASAAALILSGCAAKEGTEPGTDASPKVVVYTYNPGAGYNPDNDVAVKITANGAVDEVYYLLEKVDDFNANLESKGESGYADYVKANGTKASLETLEFNGSKYFNTIILFKNTFCFWMCIKIIIYINNTNSFRATTI